MDVVFIMFKLKFKEISKKYSEFLKKKKCSIYTKFMQFWAISAISVRFIDWSFSSCFIKYFFENYCVIGTIQWVVFYDNL